MRAVMFLASVLTSLTNQLVGSRVGKVPGLTLGIPKAITFSIEDAVLRLEDKLDLSYSDDSELAQSLVHDKLIGFGGFALVFEAHASQESVNASEGSDDATRAVASDELSDATFAVKHNVVTSYNQEDVDEFIENMRRELSALQILESGMNSTSDAARYIVGFYGAYSSLLDAEDANFIEAYEEENDVIVPQRLTGENALGVDLVLEYIRPMKVTDEIVVQDVTDLRNKKSELDRSDVTLDMQLLRNIFQQTFEAIAFCHEKDIIHGDVRPENVLLSEVADPSEVRAVLTDFGCSGPQETKIVCRSQDYPDEGKELSPATDWWGLGLVLRSLLSVAPLEKRESPLAEELLNKLLNQIPEQRGEGLAEAVHAWVEEDRQR
eukprot:TRINITY_DN26328_c0_g1_i1.p1 TRINITY_DN26328_c0_g1~~TRINITY_DN26328_c0_g1_i1.p1  ORF type:complete len:379 (+),score=59.78 TRINITY_DN26328_c0_g1_i1:78-1214(+)